MLIQLTTFILVTCVRADENMTAYIVGGKYAKINRYPHSVFLFMSCGPQMANTWYCGASILNQRLVLTAAHCVVDCSKQYKIDVFAGNADWRHTTVVRDGERFVLHGRYSKVTIRNDIAIIYTNPELPLGSRMKRVIIRSEFPDIKRAYVAGWGIVNDRTEEGTTKLKAVKQNIVPYTFCITQDPWPGSLCAESEVKDERPSSGDSGSALMTENFEQIGLVSFRRNISPDRVIYTNITYYLDWIQKASRVIFCSRRQKSRRCSDKYVLPSS